MRRVGRPSFICLILLIAAACSQSDQSSPSMHGLVLLTREGCPHAIVMRAHLEKALHAIGLPADFQFVDVGGAGPHRSTKHLSSADAALQGSRRLRNVGGDARVSPANLTGILRRSSVHRRDPTEDCYRTPLETRAPGLAPSDILVPRPVRM